MTKRKATLKRKIKRKSKKMPTGLTAWQREIWKEMN